MKRHLLTGFAILGLATALVSAPFVPFDGTSLLGDKPVFAKQGGGKDGGGKEGGGKGGGKDAGKDNGKGQGKETGKGHAKGHDQAVGKGHAKNQSKGRNKAASTTGYDGFDDDEGTSKVKGAFNAVHASPTAMSKAPSHSQVGKVKGYLDQVSADEVDTEAAAEAAVAAAKGKAIDFGMLDGVHDIADVDVDDANTHEIADIAADIQAGDFDGDDGDDNGFDGEGDDGFDGVGDDGDDGFDGDSADLGEENGDV